MRLFGLDCRCDGWRHFLLNIVDLDKGLLALQVVGDRSRDVGWNVLLVEGLELELLCRRATDLEVFQPERRLDCVL